MSDLLEKRCLPCEGGVKPLEGEQAQQLLLKTPGWQLASDQKSITKQFTFKNFYHTMGFVNAIAFIANQENHHPDLKVGYGYCDILLTTHAISGLSENDFILAAKINELVK